VGQIEAATTGGDRADPDVCHGGHSVAMSSSSGRRPPGERVRYGILGAGAIAGEMAEALASSERCCAYAVASRDPRRASAFADAHGVQRAVGSYEQLIADRSVDIVYVATPHPHHARWASAALTAGRHVLCEKPLTLNEPEARPVIELARARGRLLIEAFAYRFHPQTAALLELVSSGAIGRVCALDVTFSYRARSEDAAEPGRVLARALGGGGILDVGCYCTSAAQQIVAAATGLPSPEPQDVCGLGVLDPREGTDLHASALMRFPGDILAQLACGVMLAQDDHIRVYGTEGDIHIAQPCWLAGRREACSSITVSHADGSARVVEIPAGRHIFTIEADAVAAMLGGDVIAACEPYWRDTLANMRTLDRWRAAVGVRYEGESG
jgi:predicted dehydrogenase